MAKNKRKAKAPAKRPDPTNERIKELSRTTTIQRDTINDLTRALKSSHRAEDLFLELADVIKAQTGPLKLVKEIRISRTSDAGEFDLVLVLSDEHADQMVSLAGSWGLEYYNFDIFRCRLERLLQQIIRYATVHLPRHRFNRLWVLKLGDTVNGDIHGSSLKNHFRNTIKAAVATGDVEAQFIAALVPYFAGGVHVIAVSGNHARRSVRKDYGGAHDNFDYLVVTQMATRLANYIDDGKVGVYTPDAWTAFVNICGKNFCLNHGDDVVGFAGFPWYGFDRKNNKVQSMVARFDEKIDFYVYGHYHTDVAHPSGGARSIHSGAFPMTDPFALNKLAAGNEPVQTLYVMNEELGRVMDIPIYLRNQDKEAAFRKGKFNPELGRKLLLDQITPPVHETGFQIYKA